MQRQPVISSLTSAYRVRETDGLEHLCLEIGSWIGNGKCRASVTYWHR